MSPRSRALAAAALLLLAATGLCAQTTGDIQGRVTEVSGAPLPGVTIGRLAFRARGQAQALSLVPLNRLFKDRYAVYWKVRPPSA